MGMVYMLKRQPHVDESVSSMPPIGLHVYLLQRIDKHVLRSEVTTAVLYKC